MNTSIVVGSLLALGAVCACDRQPGNYSAVTGLRGCSTDEQCKSDELCVFRLCSARCTGDRSCRHDGEACFDTGRGAACLRREYNACVDSSDCPSATSCRRGRCASQCEPDAGDDCGDCENQLCIPRRDDREPPMRDAATGDADGHGAGLRDAGSPDAAPRDMGSRAGAPPAGASAPGSASMSSCNDGALRCEDDRSMICRRGAWVELEMCDFVCRDGACTGSCKPGTRACRNNAVLTCNSEASWSTPAPCVNACIDGACSGECAPGSQRCASNASVQVCDQRGGWATSTTCGDRACVEGSCSGVCRPGATRCSGAASLATCGPNGQWGPATICPAQACEVGACVDRCPPQNLRCAPDDPAQPQLCSADGQWENAPHCSPTQTCIEGVCRGECAPGARRCDPGDSRNYQTCSVMGEWGGAMACGGEQRCAGDGECGLGNVCPAGMSPEWWGEADGVVRTPDDPRWGGALEPFAGMGEQSMAAGYAVVFDRRANELAVMLRTRGEDSADSSDFVYFGIAGNTGAATPRAVHISLVAPSASDDPRPLSELTPYEYLSDTWSSAPSRPSWVAHPVAWISGTNPGWGVSLRVDLAAAGVDSAAPFRVALGLHAENAGGALDWTTPSGLLLADPAAVAPGAWPMLDVRAIACVSRVDVP